MCRDVTLVSLNHANNGSWFYTYAGEPNRLACREMSLIWTSSVLHFPKSLISGVSATAGAVSQSVILYKTHVAEIVVQHLHFEHVHMNHRQHLR